MRFISGIVNAPGRDGVGNGAACDGTEETPEAAMATLAGPPTVLPATCHWQVNEKLPYAPIFSRKAPKKMKRNDVGRHHVCHDAENSRLG